VFISTAWTQIAQLQKTEVWGDKNLPGGKKRPAHGADNLAAIYEPNF
jgi:hypothetical protein